MVQLNLLPDVKTKYIKAQRAKRTVVLSSVAISGTALAIVALMASVVYVAQQVQLKSLDKNIKANTAQLKKIEGLDKILTIQNQLNSLNSVHDQKPVVSRLFTFLPQITPTDVSISSYDLRFEDNSMVFNGSAKDLGTVNKFVDTLKFTEYSVDNSADTENAFSEVVLTSFSKSDKSATYSVSLKFDPKLFDVTNKTVTLVVPKITTTRSEIERPDSLFQVQPKATQGAN